MATCSIRGAITIDENSRESILNNTELLLAEILKTNDISPAEIINIIFTATKDIDAAYPAIAARGLGITQAGLMCTQEMYVEGSLKMCVRVLVTVETDKKQSMVKHIYLKGAKKLRPDISLTNINFSVAIDGPAGSGKSTIAKLIAKELGFLYADTGAMYRAVALYCINKNINYNNEKSVTDALKNIDISIFNENSIQKIYLNGADVTESVRTQEVATGSSAVAKIGAVREKLVQMQREIAKKSNIVMDGRDIGTNVLPDAQVKIYMDASADIRAERRCNELEEKGIEFNFDKIKDEIIKRDENDKNREISPLRQADDAIFIDTSDMSIDEVLKIAVNIIKEKIA